MATSLIELELANQLVAEFVNPEAAAAAVPGKAPENTPADKGPVKPLPEKVP